MIPTRIGSALPIGVLIKRNDIDVATLACRDAVIPVARAEESPAHLAETGVTAVRWAMQLVAPTFWSRIRIEVCACTVVAIRPGDKRSVSLGTSGQRG